MIVGITTEIERAEAERSEPIVQKILLSPEFRKKLRVAVFQSASEEDRLSLTGAGIDVSLENIIGPVSGQIDENPNAASMPSIPRPFRVMRKRGRPRLADVAKKAEGITDIFDPSVSFMDHVRKSRIEEIQNAVKVNKGRGGNKGAPKEKGPKRGLKKNHEGNPRPQKKNAVKRYGERFQASLGGRHARGDYCSKTGHFILISGSEICPDRSIKGYPDRDVILDLVERHSKTRVLACGTLVIGSELRVCSPYIAASMVMGSKRKSSDWRNESGVPLQPLKIDRSNFDHVFPDGMKVVFDEDCHAPHLS